MLTHKKDIFILLIIIGFSIFWYVNGLLKNQNSKLCHECVNQRSVGLFFEQKNNIPYSQYKEDVSDVFKENVDTTSRQDRVKKNIFLIAVIVTFGTIFVSFIRKRINFSVISVLFLAFLLSGMRQYADYLLWGAVLNIDDFLYSIPENILAVLAVYIGLKLSSELWSNKWQIPLSISHFKSKEYIVSVFRGYGIFLVIGLFAHIFVYAFQNYMSSVGMMVNDPGISHLSLPVAILLMAIVNGVIVFFEEIVFRLFWVSFLLKKTRSVSVAVITSSLLWALMHLFMVPHSIEYFKILDIFITGIFFGLFFIKYGAWPVIIAHYTLNMSLLLVGFAVNYNWLSFTYSLFFIFLPLFIPLFLKVWSRMILKNKYNFIKFLLL